MPGSRKNKLRVIREIKKEQLKTSSVIPIAPFTRIVHAIAEEHLAEVRFKKEAMEALQVGAESYLIDHLHKAYTIAVKSGRETLSISDMRLLRTLNTDTII